MCLDHCNLNIDLNPKSTNKNHPTRGLKLGDWEFYLSQETSSLPSRVTLQDTSLAGTEEEGEEEEEVEDNEEGEEDEEVEDNEEGEED